MVRGLGAFRAHFAGYEKHYVLIGGAAVDVLMNEAGLEFRATKDLDVVLIVEALDAEFGRVVWDFIERGRYDNRHKNTGEVCFYRFHTPADESYPYMIDLFSREPDGINLPQGAHLTPLPVDERLSSLSAILLDEAYYQFILSGAREVEGLSLLGPEYLVPLKMKAWLDLRARRDSGHEVQSDDIKKHRRDVVRLSQLIPAGVRVALPDGIAVDVRAFLDTAIGDDFDPETIKVRGVSAAEIVGALRTAYGVA